MGNKSTFDYIEIKKNSYLMLGDASECLSILDPNSIDLIVTDPPYGIKYKSSKQNYNTTGDSPIKINRPEYFTKIKNDKNIPNIKWLKQAFRVLKDNSAIYIFIHWKTVGKLILQCEQANFKIKNLIVINKSNHGMGDLKGQFAPKHELLLFATKGRHLLNFKNGRKNDVWDMPVNYSGAIRLHPNEKPKKWIMPILEYSSKESGTILDPFMGSGSTGEVAFQFKQNFIGIDCDKQWYNMAIERLKKYE